MPLYNNILSSSRRKQPNQTPVEETTAPADASLSNASMKLLQDHLKSKRRVQQQNSHLKVNKTNKPSKSSDNIISESNLHKPPDDDWGPEQEYDPMIPNSYEVLMLEYLKLKELQMSQVKAQPTSSLPRNSKIPIANLLDVMDQLDDEDDHLSAEIPNTRKGTLIAPPSSLSTTTQPEDDTLNKQTQSKASGGSIAAKIMSKMGYKAGQGLGKDEQGINTALEVERLGVNSGRIVTVDNQVSQDKHVEPAHGKHVSDQSINKLLLDSTRILLLQNMVGPGEVDDDLEAETKEECKKYGKVVKCLIYEIPNKKVPDDQAVRIFVEFESVDSTIKAVNDLNGRYFGGRTVKASFYNLDRFNKLELGPERHR